MSVFKSVILRVLRPAGSLFLSAGLAALMHSDAGLIAAPILRAISEAIHEYFKQRGGIIPPWVSWIPF